MKLVQIKILFAVFFSATLFTACSSSSSGGEDDNPPPPTAIPDPSATTLVFPENNTECNTGAILNEAQSNVTFRWNASENTDSYQLNVTNLNTNGTTRSVVTTNESTLLIDRGTPYEWFVVSRAAGTTNTAESPSWRFYNEGPGVENYAPFPAEALNPKRGENVNSSGLVNLEWDASDVDNDITEYEVLFGDSNPPTESLGITTDKFINNVTVIDNTIYYWQVKTKDSQGNTSNSETFQFKTQ